MKKKKIKNNQVDEFNIVHETMILHLSERSRIRGKALNILIPTIKDSDLTDLLAELYDLRKYKKGYRTTEQLSKELKEKNE